MSLNSSQAPSVELTRLGRGEYHGDIRVIVPCHADRAWARLRRLDALHEIIPFCDSSRAEEIEDELAVRLAIKVGLPRPFPGVHYVVRAELDEDARSVSWTRVSGNLKKNEGSLGFEPISAKRCEARYQCLVAVGFPVPRLAETIMQRLVLPRVMKKLVLRLARS